MGEQLLRARIDHHGVEADDPDLLVDGKRSDDDDGEYADATEGGENAEDGGGDGVGGMQPPAHHDIGET